MKTSKLYTEEQVKYAIQVAFDAEPPCKVKDVLRDLTPIELPTDEEIEEASTTVLMGKYPYHPPKDYGYWKDMFIEGVKWMRDKIKGGSHE